MMSEDEAEYFAQSEGLELLFVQFQALVVHLSHLKERQVKKSIRAEDVPDKFEEWVAKTTDSCVQQLILPLYEKGAFNRAAADYKSPKDENSEGSIRHEISDTIVHSRPNATERKKLAEGVSALKTASEVESEWKHRASSRS